MRLLLVEDEDAIAEPLAEGLRREGFVVERAATGQEALAAGEPDLVLLDLGLPDTDGFSVCRELRSRSSVPIIVVTAKGEEVDRVVGLELDTRSRRVFVDGREIDLTPKEFDLLALLASDPGAVFARAHILEVVWETTWFGSAKTIDVHVAALRRKLGHPSWIETVRGVGLRLNVPG